MNERNPAMALVQQKRTVADMINSEKTRLEIAKVLPKHLTPERMTRVALTATMKNPQLLQCTPASLMNALLVCSQAGLEPDGRLAHLIPYKDQVQVIFDYKGLVTLALRNGAQSVFADKVCEHDQFDAGVELGQKVITHKINWKKERGTPVCYYAICKRGDEIDWEVMTVDEVESIRRRSRAANSGPWVTDFDEMAKKTVLRRMSKRWDLLPEIRDVINADDDTPAFNAPAAMARPIFEIPPATVADKPAVETPAETLPQETVSDDGDGYRDPIAPKIGTPAPEPASANPLKALRGLCKLGKIKEGELMDYWASTGATDGSSSSLEEVQMSSPQVIVSTYNEWGKVESDIKARKEAK